MKCPVCFEATLQTVICFWCGQSRCIERCHASGAGCFCAELERSGVFSREEPA